MRHLTPDRRRYGLPFWNKAVAGLIRKGGPERWPKTMATTNAWSASNAAETSEKRELI